MLHSFTVARWSEGESGTAFWVLLPGVRSHWRGSVLLVSFLAVWVGGGCSGSEGDDGDGPGAGGVGAAATGGAISSGAALSAGTTSATGGVRVTGGATSIGGSTTGGVIATGGAASAGGGMSTGGMSTGGVASTGGSGTGAGGSSGGVLATGGVPPAGGAPDTGGAVATGGAPPTGGTPGWLAELVGWASVEACGPNGTTGGGDGEPAVTVTTGNELQAALTSSGPAVIAVSGSIAAPDSVTGVRDKTLIGLSGAEITGGLSLGSSRNVIIKNIRFRDGSGGAGDTFELTGSECVWFDHCEFVDGEDGNLDIVRASDLITVSWSRFYYTRGHEHMLSNLCGNANDRPDDVGKINITFHHNWWGAGVKERMPRVRYGQVHVFNNYYRYEPVAGDTGQSYCIAAGQNAKLLVEGNYFDGSSSPIRWMSDEGTGEVVERDNAFVNTSGEVVTRGASFAPPYPYATDPANLVRDIVMSGAGSQ